MMTFRELYSKYNLQVTPALKYMAFLSKVRAKFPDKLKGQTSINDLVFEESEILELEKIFEVTFIDKPKELEFDKDISDEVQEFNDTITNITEEKVLLTDSYEDTLGNEVNVGDIERLTGRMNDITNEMALKKINELMKSPKRISKIILEFRHKNSPLFMATLLKDYTFAIIPYIWQIKGKNWNIYNSNVVKLFRWEYKHVVVFNDTEILHIF